MTYTVEVSWDEVRRVLGDRYLPVGTYRSSLHFMGAEMDPKKDNALHGVGLRLVVEPVEAGSLEWVDGTPAP